MREKLTPLPRDERFIWKRRERRLAKKKEPLASGGARTSQRALRSARRDRRSVDEEVPLLRDRIVLTREHRFGGVTTGCKHGVAARLRDIQRLAAAELWV